MIVVCCAVLLVGSYCHKPAAESLVFARNFARVQPPLMQTHMENQSKARGLQYDHAKTPRSKKLPTGRKQQLLRKNERLTNPELSNDAKPFLIFSFQLLQTMWQDALTDDGMITDCREGTGAV